MSKSLLLTILLLLTFTIVNAQKRGFDVDELINQMTIEEKIDFVSGYNNFHIHGLERLGIPEVLMADGPMGVNGHGKSTAFPASICMAATWNPELIEEMAGAIALEARSKSIGVLLAPGVNMYRIPNCGRNFEYYGEDPYLASRTAVAFINGIQNNGVMATVKHFVANKPRL